MAGSIPVGYIYFHFELFTCLPSLQLGGALAHEIKHDNSHVVNVSTVVKFGTLHGLFGAECSIYEPYSGQTGVI